MIWLGLLLLLSVTANIVLAFLLRRAAKRLLEFDDLFELFTHDIETNLKFFETLKSRSLISNTPEVMEVHKNMMIIGKRLDEYANQFEEQAGRDLRMSVIKKENA